MRLSRRLVAVATGVALAFGVGVMGAAPAMAQAGAITNPGCTTNTYIYIKTVTTGPTTHYYTSTSGSQKSWNLGDLPSGSERKTATGYSTAQSVSAAATVLTSIAYACG
ncbi:MAG: hypothetical protein LBI33_01790 [Propionibacteriaceae bacterium]|nr:hypothetical protein [Propionibacteriaceae bacterium]